MERTSFSSINKKNKKKDVKYQKSLVSPKSKAISQKKALWTSKDTLFVVIASTILFIMMFLTLIISYRASNMENDLQNKNNQLKKISTDNEKSQQKLNKSISIYKLQKFAKKNGMSLNSKNIQQINK